MIHVPLFEEKHVWVLKCNIKSRDEMMLSHRPCIEYLTACDTKVLFTLSKDGEEGASIRPVVRSQKARWLAVCCD